MAKKHRGGKLHRGPFTTADFVKALTSIGYESVPGTKHRAFKHPDRPGKVNVGSWQNVKAGHTVFASVARQANLTNEQLLRLLNGLDA
jgi:hypothetical protein